MKRSVRVVLVSVLCTAFVLVAMAALAAPKKKSGEGSGKSRDKTERKHRSRADRKRDEKAAAALADAGATSPRSLGTPAGDAGVVATGVKEEKRTDAGSSYKFGELEIEGRLKTPQIVYFLRRVRAEFAAQDLGHRTFTGELKDTRKEPSF